MRSEWRNYKLGDITQFSYGKMPKKEYLNTGIYPTFSGYRYQYLYPEKNCKKGDIIVVARGVGGTGDVKIVKEDCYLTNLAIKFDLNNEIIDNQYCFYHYFLSTLRHLDSGSAQSQITINDLTNLEITFPPLQTQKKIAHILSTLDDKIELNRKMNQTLKAMAQALFKSWFVDFDPVHVKLTCKSEEELNIAAKKLGISKEILDLFPNEFEESELGIIPKGWRVAKIEEILKRCQAPTRYKKDAVQSYGKTIVFEQGANIILGYHDKNGEFEATVSKPMFIFGDHTCVMKLSTKPFSISENVIPLAGSIRNGYWTYYATYGQQSFQEYRRHWSELIVRNIVLADMFICDLFADKVQSLILKIEQNILENNELIKTRDMLLPKLLSGELDVSELELDMALI